MDSNNNDTEIPEDLPEEQALQLKVKYFACRTKAKAKTVEKKKKTCCYSTSIIPMNERNWIGIEPGNSLCIRGFEESNPSSSTFSERTTRGWWSSSILENKRTSSESIPKKFLLGLTIVEKKMLGSKKSEKEIPVMHWRFWNNCLSPSSSRTFTTQSYWSLVVRKCCDSGRILATY